MPGTMIELAVLRRDSRQDARALVERLAAIGPVVLLDGLHSGAYSAVIASASGELLPEPWTGHDRSLADLADDQPVGRHADARTVARLEAVRSEHGVDWLIATEATLPSARACKGLRVICIGPGDERPDPTRPDHRAHGLLDAVRFIETSAAFS
jgi:hypothetical protein